MNSYKHGLTGEGLALPTEDAEAVAEQFRILQDEMKPATERARLLVERAALFAIRLRRSALFEAKNLSHRIRYAAEQFDATRLAEVDHAYSWIAHEPATHARTLRRTPEGVDRLLVALRNLRSDLKCPTGFKWSHQHGDQLHHLLGLRSADVPVSRARALSEAVMGRFDHLEPGEGLDAEDRVVYAGRLLVALIDREIGSLESLMGTFDTEALAQDRAEAAHRAMFDGSKEATLARKYEATNERAFHKALKEFDEVQARTPEVDDTKEVASGFPGEMASFSPEPEGEAADTESDDPEALDPVPATFESPAISPFSRQERRPEATEGPPRRS